MAETLLLRGLLIDHPADPVRERPRGRITVDTELELNPSENTGEAIELRAIADVLRQSSAESDWRRLEELADLLVDSLLTEFEMIAGVDLTVWSLAPRLANAQVDAVGARKTKRRGSPPRRRSLTPAKPGR